MSADGRRVVSCGHTVGALWTADGTTGEGTGAFQPAECMSCSTASAALRAAIRTGSHAGENGGA